jgi:Holliday junction resolvase-like predicted endonuclease
VFVEVKTRAQETPYHPTLAMTEEKKQRVRMLGDYYCAQHPEPSLQPRFDVVAVTLRPQGRTGTARVEHFINAF